MSETEAVSGKVVVIDPGHGGPDPGAVGRSGTLEKDVVLQVARLLTPMLNRSAVYTLSLRDGDYDMVEKEGAVPSGSRKREDLGLRVNLARLEGADLYISLHANSFPSARWRGAQTFYYPGKDDDKKLAEAIQHHLLKMDPVNTRTARPGEYFVLREAAMPAVVIELGFLSHPEEEKLLKTPDHQRGLAQAIHDGIVDYLVGAFQPLPDRPTEEDAPVLQVDNFSTALNSGVNRPLMGETQFAVFHPLVVGEGTDQERLAPMIREFPEALVDVDTEDRIAYVLQAFFDGLPPDSGLISAAPPGVKVLSARFEEGILSVDLSREVRTRFWGGGVSETLLLNSLLATVSQFQDVRFVRITVEGESGGVLAGHIDIDIPLPAVSPNH